jgi:serine/threonine-protein kinase HipA
LFEAFTAYPATQLDLPAAPVKPIHLGGHTLSLSERFDRRTQGARVVRLHQEDLCQAEGLSRADKHRRSPAPFSAIAEILRGHSTQPAHDIQTQAAWQIFNALAGNTDGHLKNLSLLATPGEGWTLAPWYDLVCTLAVPRISHRMALPIGGKGYPQHLHRNHRDSFAHELGVSPRLVQRLKRAAQDDRWSQALAVGSEPFVREVHAQLGIRAVDRSVYSDADNSQLAEDRAPYSHVPGPKWPF